MKPLFFLLPLSFSLNLYLLPFSLISLSLHGHSWSLFNLLFYFSIYPFLLTLSLSFICLHLEKYRCNQSDQQESKKKKKIQPFLLPPPPQTLSMVVSSQTKREEQSPCGYHLFIYYKSKHKLLPELHNCLTLQGNDIPTPFTGDWYSSLMPANPNCKCDTAAVYILPIYFGRGKGHLI